MSADKKENVDVPAQNTAQGSYQTKDEEAEASRTHLAVADDAPPPAYSSLAEEVSADIRAMRDGDPKETISVPMIHSMQNTNYKKLFSKDRKTVTRTVIVRQMPREYYLKHYAKDEEGNYIGTEKAAADAALVFVPGSNTPEDILKQVHQVAFGKMHHPMDFSAGASLLGMIVPGAGS